MPTIPLEGVDESSAAAFRALLATLRLHRQLMIRTLAASGTHPGQAFCLQALASKDDVTQRDLAETLQVSRPTLSRMLQAMEEGGLVVRRADDDDQRLTRVRLTDAGRSLERELRAVAATHVEQTLGGLPRADRTELARILGDLAASMRETLEAHTDAPAARGAGAKAPEKP